jgi:hypothetical protein
VAADISHGRGIIAGVQGRYLIPAALPLFLAFSSRRCRVRAGWWAMLLLGFAAIANTLAIYRIAAAYYAPSSALPMSAALSRSTLIHQGFLGWHFEGNLLRGPGPYPPQDGAVYFVRDGKRHRVEDSRWIVSHGYRWPDDMIVIPRAQLDAIPLSDAAGDGAHVGWLARRPGSTPEDEKVYIVKDGVKHWVPDRQWIIENGFRWPGDVKVIPARELDAIPTGAVIEYKPAR